MIPTISAFTDTKIKSFKALTWEKNHNGKLHTNGFIHLDLAPKQMPTDEQLKETVFVITCREEPGKQHYFKVLHVDPIASAALIPERTIAASHGLEITAFFDLMFKTYPNKFNWNTRMALYFYLRVIPE